MVQTGAGPASARRLTTCRCLDLRNDRRDRRFARQPHSSNRHRPDSISTFASGAKGWIYSSWRKDCLRAFRPRPCLAWRPRPENSNPAPGCCVVGAVRRAFVRVPNHRTQTRHSSDLSSSRRGRLQPGPRCRSRRSHQRSQGCQRSRRWNRHLPARGPFRPPAPPAGLRRREDPPAGAPCRARQPGHHVRPSARAAVLDDVGYAALRMFRRQRRSGCDRSTGLLALLFGGSGASAPVWIFYLTGCRQACRHRRGFARRAGDSLKA